MLILKLRQGQSLIIKTPNNDVIKVTLTNYRDVQTEVGIEAPVDYVVIREERYGRKDNTRY